MNRRVLIKHFVGILFLFFILPRVYAQAKSPANYKVPRVCRIEGFAHSFDDSTLLYLAEIMDLGKGQPRVLDSTLILNQRFFLIDHISNKISPRYYILYTKSYSDMKYIWVDSEAYSISVSGSKGNFKNALVIGSKIQQLSDQLQRCIEPIQIEIDSLQRNFGSTDSVIWKRVLALEDSLKQSFIDFIDKHPTSILSASLLYTYAKQWGADLSRKLYQSLSYGNKSNSLGKAVKNYIDLSREISIGNSYVDIKQRNQNEQTLSLSMHKGKYILLEFWASWCGPCRKENPNLVKLYKQFNTRGFEIFGVSIDNNYTNWQAAIKADGLLWANVSDLKGSENEAALIYNVYQIPTNYLIDRDGKIIAKNLRGDHLKRVLERIFEKENSLSEN